MPANLLILPLLGGYWLIHYCYYFRFRAQRLEGYRLLSEAALAGAGLALLARLVIVCLDLLPWSQHLNHSWSRFAPLDFSGTAIVAMGVGLILPFALNRWWLRADDAKILAIERHGDELLRIIQRAADEERPMSITLGNRKVYVGYVGRAPNFEPASHLLILPLLSGYRTGEELRLVLTKNYALAFVPGVDWEVFLTVIPLSSITTASFYDAEIHERFFA